MEQLPEGSVFTEGQSEERSGVLTTLGFLAASSTVNHEIILESRFLPAEKAAQLDENHLPFPFFFFF